MLETGTVVSDVCIEIRASGDLYLLLAGLRPENFIDMYHAVPLSLVELNGMLTERPSSLQRNILQLAPLVPALQVQASRLICIW